MEKMKPDGHKPCPCGSGKAQEKCCQEKIRAAAPGSPIKRADPTPNERNRLAALLNARQITKLESLARLLLEQYPESGFVWNMLGIALQMQGKDSLSALQNAAQFSPGDTDVYNNLGNAFSDLGRLEEAEASYRRALQINPNNISALNNMGITLCDLGRLEEAETSYRRVLQLKPGIAEAHINLSNILSQLVRLDEAEASLRVALKNMPGNAELHLSLSYVLDSLERLNEAEASSRRALEIKPDFAEAYVKLSYILAKLGRLSEAEAICRRALELNPGLEEAYCSLGDIFWELGRLDEAEASLRQALKLKPDNPRTPCNLVDVIKAQGRFFEALDIARSILRGMSDQEPQSSTHTEMGAPVTALLPLGRSGSLFFHSLFDGHPELATLPGIYFKGWFDRDIWKRFAPKPKDAGWREHLVKEIINEFQPLFDARSQKKVAGNALSGSTWLSRDCGFMDMGADRSQFFVIDQNAFAASLLTLLAPLPSVSQKTCFELIHRAFEIAIRGNMAAASREDGQIFYHIHNPSTFEFARFLHCYPRARLLYIVRHPVQGVESWMLANTNAGTHILDSLRSADPSGKKETDYLLERWGGVVDVVRNVFHQLHLPFNTLAHSRGVRLEDVKRDARRVMPQVAAWMGISDHPSLYETSFCGLQYWGPASKVTGKITGFDTKAIDRPIGRLLGPRDIMIFETLFWPFSHLYGYTDLDKDRFRRQLAEIRHWLDEPLEFEIRLYAELSDHSRTLEELLPYNRLHRLLQQTWTVLDQGGTYHGMAQPLELQ